MKIKLSRDIPVSKKHGLTKGRIFDVVGPPGGRENPGETWVLGDVGRRLRVFPSEYDIVK